MNNIIKKLVVASVAISAPIAIQAAVIDRVENTVERIENKADSIKSKTTAIDTKVSELASTANATILETVDIKALLEPLDMVQMMKANFASGGFDPSEILDFVETDKIQAVMDEMRQNRADVQAMIADPGLESFRADFLEVLAGINILTGASGLEMTPFQQFIQNAPPPVIGALKVAGDSAFAPLLESVQAAIEDFQMIQSFGLMNAHYSSEPNSGFRKVSGDSDSEALCNAVSNFGFNQVQGTMWRYQKHLVNIGYHSGTLNKKALTILSKIPTLPDIGIHGYLTIPLSKIDLEAKYSKLSDNDELEYAKDMNELYMTKVEWIAEKPEAVCGFAFANHPVPSQGPELKVKQSL